VLRSTILMVGSSTTSTVMHKGIEKGRLNYSDALFLCSSLTYVLVSFLSVGTPFPIGVSVPRERGK
jgi:hypothetical protein